MAFLMSPYSNNKKVINTYRLPLLCHIPTPTPVPPNPLAQLSAGCQHVCPGTHTLPHPYHP